MKIVVLEGSPNRHASSNLLAEEFIRGAKEAGHTAEIIDAAHADLHPCTGCVRCGYECPCVQKDDMEKFRGQILDADMMVFVTPLYYYGMSAQLKMLVDRFCAIKQQHHPQAREIRPARRRMECGQLDVRGAGGPLPDAGAVSSDGRPGYGFREGLRHAVHDGPFPLSPAGL